MIKKVKNTYYDNYPLLNILNLLVIFLLDSSKYLDTKDIDTIIIFYNII